MGAKMTKQTLTLNYIPTTLNEYINAERGNRFQGAKIKRNETEKIIWLCRAQYLKPIDTKVKIDFTWFVANRRKDPDNIAFTKKFILDGLVKAGVLKNDNLNVIVGFSDKFVLVKDKKNIGCLIEINPV